MDKVIDIGGKRIGKGKLVFMIAEAGVNHNGKLRVAKQLVHAAKWAGADAIKFQTFTSENLVTEHAGMANYQIKNTKYQSQLKMLKDLELNEKEFKELKEHCDKKGILFLSTPHTEDAIDFLEPLVPIYKVGSGDLTNTPFLVKLAKKGKPILLSTGMSNLEEVREAVNSIKSFNQRLVIMHCTTSYPCARKEVNLRAMQTIGKEFDCLVGYSDHTLGTDVMVMSVAMGATVVEKHLTLDTTMKGPDHKASIDPIEFREGVYKVRNIQKYNVALDEEVLGSSEKKPTKSELTITPLIRKGIFSSKSIKSNEKFTPYNLAIKRPGKGLPPKYLNEIINKRSRMDIRKDTPIRFGMVK